jgi:Type IV pili methyl-accepting chemotaxis transducer N-term
MKRRTLLIASTLCAANLAHAQVIHLNDAINKAGRQRMLSQRMAKSYLALGQQVTPELAARTLAASMALFDRQLFELKAYATRVSAGKESRAKLIDTYAQLDRYWSDYKVALIGEPPSKAGALTVLQLAGRVLSMAHEGTVQFEKTTNQASSQLVNVAGRQRMLSQRMAAFYLSAHWGVQTEASIKEITTARNEYSQAHQLLAQAPETAVQIGAELQLASQQFVFFEAALDRTYLKSANSYASTEVFNTSERILQIMDKVTGLYAKLNS